MAYINLLPWREESKKEKQKQYFLMLLAVALFAIAITLIVSQFYQIHIDGQNSKNQYLINEIKKLDVRIVEIKNLNEKKSELEKRISVIQQLQRSRNVGTQVLDEVTKIVPNGVYLTSLSKQGNAIELNGRSESNNHLANMLRDIESSIFLTSAQLSSILNNDKESRLLSEFVMRVRIKGLISDEELAKANSEKGAGK